MRRRTGGGWPLGFQLALGFTLITVLTLGIVGTLLVNQITRRQLSERTALVLAQARAAADLAGEVRFEQQPAGLPLALFTFHLQTGVRPLVVGTDGEVVADSWIPSPLVGTILSHPELGHALTGTEASGYRQLETGEWVLYAAAPMSAGQRTGRAVLVVADLSDLQTGVARTRQELSWGLTIGGIAASAAGLVMANYLARPLRRLDRTVATVAQGNLEARVEPAGSREMRRLGRRFNHMAGELAKVDAQRRRFVAAASHEMRTPVAAIRAMAEALLGDREGDLALYREYLQDIVNEADRARHVMDRLLELARLEAQTEPRPHRTVNVTSICTETVEHLLPLARQRGVDVAVPRASAAGWIMGESFLVETAVVNLVENAVKYTPSGGEVEVTVTAGPDEVCVTIRDTGPGIDPEHVPHLFDRFYRIDPSRARPTGGVGLGLALTAEAVRLLDGRLEVTSTPGQGSTFTLVLPAAPAG